MGSLRMASAVWAQALLLCAVHSSQLALQAAQQPVTASAAATASAPVTAGTAAARPNIVVILSDDMGYSDIGCYGGEMSTPTLDALAAGGLRFTQFYNTARCCPTRAALLTGLYPHQTGIGWMMTDNGFDGYRGELNRRCRTLAEVLRPAGYGTYAVGKWHVTRNVRPDGSKDNWPLQRGFERFYGTIHGAGSFYDPNSLTRDNTQISPYADPEYQPDVYYYTDAISDQAVRFVHEHQQQRGDRPLFLYVAYTAAHWPMHALPEDIARYRGRFDSGYAALRTERLQRMLQLGVVAPGTELSPVAEDWTTVTDREWELRCMEVYAAMIDRMDQGIGRITAALQHTGRLDNTLILYMQDNGGCAETLGRGPQQTAVTRDSVPRFPAMSADTLQTDMIPQQSRDGFPVRQGRGVLPGPADTFVAYGRGWANVSNTPFREFKHWVHEGGISSPLIAHWPAGINQRGALFHQPAHLIDIMATCVDLSGATYPTAVEDISIQPMEGISLRPAFLGQPLSREALYWEHEGNRAVRQGDWKLVAKNSDGPWELYNIAIDRAELHDQASTEPARVAAMAQLWAAWAARAQVLPLTPYFEKQTSAGFSTRQRFELQADTRWPRQDSPHIANKGFLCTLQLPAPGTQGVLLAQGGSSAGYALYIRDGQLHFAIRQRGELQTVHGQPPVRPGTLRLQLGRDGVVTVQLDEQSLLEGRVSGPLNVMPQDGLDVGTDTGGLVGEYDKNFRFDGRITSGVFTIQ